MSAVTGVIKMGELYLLVSGMNIIGRVYIPQYCFSACQTSQNVKDCNCGAINLINNLSLSGRVVDIRDCYDVYSCVRKLSSS